LIISWISIWFLEIFLISGEEEARHEVDPIEKKSLLSSYSISRHFTSTSNNWLVRPNSVSSVLSQITVCCYTYFAYMLFCATLDTSVTPLTDRFFGFTDVQNGYLVLACGSVSFCSYFLMQLGWVERILPESSMMLFGLCLNTIVLSGMLIYLPFASFRARWIYAVQGCLLFLFSFSVPFINVGSISVLNTFSPHDDQSKLQGIRSSLGRIAKVLGSIWTGVTIHSFFLIFSLPFIFVFTATLLTFHARHILKTTQTQSYYTNLKYISMLCPLCYDKILVEICYVPL
jgi:hypothetical protein